MMIPEAAALSPPSADPRAIAAEPATDAASDDVSGALIRLEDLSVAFRGRPAVQSVSLAVRRGETLGVVGESGAGKSVTWLAALGLLSRRATVGGRVVLRGRDILGVSEAQLSRVRGGQIAMIFQDPGAALNPMLTVRRQIGEALALHRGLSGNGLVAETLRLLDLVGIPAARARVSAYPHEFSGGQSQRLMIAMALAGQPDLLIADEPTTALDVTIQAQILDLLAWVQSETGMAMVLISHDLGVVSQTCDRVAVMYAGRIVEEATSARIFSDAVHPYTQALIAALPRIDGPRARLKTIAGTLPDPESPEPGCAFAPRCDRVREGCIRSSPGLASLDASQRVACPPALADRSGPWEM